MFPIRDTIPSKRYPIVNNGIIALNVLVYVFVNLLNYESLEEYFLLYGLVPVRYTDPYVAEYFSIFEQVFSFLSFMFLHGGLFHLIGNMWSLYIFGDNVEDRLGPVRYLLFYLACGLASGLMHLFTNLDSRIPTVGASGAIAGVMGAYFILYPHSKVLTIIPIFFLPYFVELPAVIFLGLWLLSQFIGVLFTPPGVGGIAWWAHIGGFIAGLIFLKIFSREDGAHSYSWLHKRHTPRLQIIHTFGTENDYDLRGTIEITPRESIFGAKKLVCIPDGAKKRSFLISIPPGTSHGMVLRLPGLGRKGFGKVGDLYLTVNVGGDI